MSSEESGSESSRSTRSEASDDDDYTKCKECGLECGDRKALSNHMRMHRGNFACPTCGSVFTREFHMRDHMRMHTGDLYRCDEPGCDCAYATSASLKRHWGRTHSPAIVRLKCEWCAETFAKKYQLRKHMSEMHTGGKPLKCPQCSSTFMYESQRQRHINSIHLAKFICSVGLCAATFTDAKSLKKHLLEDHVAEECGRCGEAVPEGKKPEGEEEESPRKTRASAKKKQKEEGNQFVCPQCAFVYETRGGLRSHTKVEHEGQRFTCEHEGCGKVFRYNSSLQAHIRKEHSAGDPADPEAVAAAPAPKRKRVSQDPERLLEDIVGFIQPVPAAAAADLEAASSAAAIFPSSAPCSVAASAEIVAELAQDDIFAPAPQEAIPTSVQ